MGAKAIRRKIKDKNGKVLTYRQVISQSLKGTIDNNLGQITHKSGAKMHKKLPFDELSYAIEG